MLQEQASEAERKKLKRKSNMTFGWDVFNEDTLYKAYFKKCKKLEGNDIDEDRVEEGDRVEEMAKDVEEQREKRN